MHEKVEVCASVAKFGNTARHGIESFQELDKDKQQSIKYHRRGVTAMPILIKQTANDGWIGQIHT